MQPDILGLPDFQYATTRNPLMDSIRECIMPLECKTFDQCLRHILALTKYPDEKLKAFKLNTTSGIHLYPDIGPAAVFSQSAMSLNYAWVSQDYLNPSTNPRKIVTVRIRVFNLPRMPQASYKLRI
jgi:hypothetical protein